MAGRNKKLVEGCQQALNQMKYEVSSELGVPLGHSFGSFGADSEFAGELGSVGSVQMGNAYGGNLTSRETGSVGGEITKRLVRQAQQTIL
jgi:hypothetical protein